MTTVSEEAKNPKKDIPRAVLWGTIICGAIYISFSFVVVGIAHFSAQYSKTAVAEVFS